MLEVTRYQCEYCWKLFSTKEECLRHEEKERALLKARNMLNNGKTLKEIQEECNIWADLPKELYNVSKDYCFKDSFWIGLKRQWYKITSIQMNGWVRLCSYDRDGQSYGYWTDINDPILKNQI